MGVGVLVAVDVGSVRVGVAACDAAGVLAFPLEVVAQGPAAIPRIVELVRERDAHGVVVGHPLRLDGTRGPAAEAAESFAAVLAAALTPTPVRLYDERLTTAAAQRSLHQAGRSTKDSRPVIDAAAAVQLLEDALAATRAAGGDRVGTVVTPRTVESGS
jgi:putative Holliday junction resolvase